MPTLARFELEVHRREERGEGLSADDMIGLMADLFAEGYGAGVHVDRERTRITWATFGHLYVDYYVFQYATGISGANALAQRILSGTSGAVEDYLSFLKAGDSLYPVDALKLAASHLNEAAVADEAGAVTVKIAEKLDPKISAEIGPALRQVQAPTLVIHGAAHPIAVANATEWAATLPDARLLIMPGVGHFPYLKAPAPSW